MKSKVQTPEQQEMFRTLIVPVTGVVQSFIGTLMFIIMNSLGQPAGTHAVEIFAIELIVMSVIVYFAVPAIGSKFVDHMILRNHKSAAD